MEKSMCETNIGEKFGKWVIVSSNYILVRGHRHYLCHCSCGKSEDRYVDIYNLKYRKSTSCGCAQIEQIINRSTTHGGKHTRLYGVWRGMKNRCFNPNDSHYRLYGGRGITICPEWLDFEEFRNWAYKNGFDEKLSSKNCTIDRIDVNGNYEPSNCRWTDSKTQSLNMRSNVRVEYNGECLCLKEWSEKLGIRYGTLKQRYRRGYRGESLFSVKNLQTGNAL